MVMTKNVLLVGCGDIGIALSQGLLTDGFEVWGARRRIEALPATIRPLQLDVLAPESMMALSAQDYDSVVVTLTPGTFSDRRYRQIYVEGLRNLLAALRVSEARPHIYFVSSTSVYHQHQGEWVDERSATEPSRFSGQRLLQAEQLLVESDFPYSIIRCSGIYGPGRYRLLEQIARGQSSASEPDIYSNRIHRDDCVGFLRHLLGLQRAGRRLQPLYLATDNEPAPLFDVQQWLAQQLGVTLQTMMDISKQRAGSKRCANKLMLASGYRLHYPDYRAGYGALLRDDPCWKAKIGK